MKLSSEELFVRELSAIDAHAHFNHKGESYPDFPGAHKRGLDHLIKMTSAAGVDKVFCTTYEGIYDSKRVYEENDFLFNYSLSNDWCYQWVLVNPLDIDTIKQAREMLHRGKCVGIKLHPCAHGYELEDEADKIFPLAEEMGAKVVTHPTSGDFEEYVRIADKYPNATLIVAHMHKPEYVDIIKRAKYQNIYTDTSGGKSNLNYVIEYAVEQGIADRVLYGSDGYSTAFQRGRIEMALIPNEDKVKILCDNAKRLWKDFID